MALLINVGHDGWMGDDEIAKILSAHTPTSDVRTLADPGDLSEVSMLAVSRLDPDLPHRLPNLQLVQKLGAGVETIVRHPALPDHVRVTRLKPEAPAREIAEWFLTYILNAQRQGDRYRRQQTQADWSPVAPLITTQTQVGVLGLGHIGGYTARLLDQLGFQVHGWSRSPKSLPGVTCHHGYDALPALLGRCDHICAILPSTPETEGLIDARMLAAMKPGSQLLNAGRGDLIDEAELLQALDRGTPGLAVLDVVSQEPLPANSPLWSHPKLTLTPHVSGWHLGDALKDVAENLRRLSAGEDLLHEVDRARGY
ncbi:glyoxylate/hydroxypyruvate reductase A [Ruegeria sp. 2205SS24-7]|uniref:2-hydroxyacid dehydrogenase n=1 Tax=Ruegeria discodermiae TaxID=3064389 RepID=UPI002740802F|nr:glyoxylate/hydroxypyruvate reductase A [Ruegeria sp. 2205SS24-7]MDP5218669.1 glyoxylate/hydroxypyruvate reductase A [Ruegeria sp. 2205SS24-7]